jgi:hypothetical protein
LGKTRAFFACRLPALSPHLKFFSSSLIQVPFLNLMANILSRSGSFMIRVGGNTQETAQVTYDALPNGRVMEKNLSGVSNPVGH